LILIAFVYPVKFWISSVADFAPTVNLSSNAVRMPTPQTGCRILLSSVFRKAAARALLLCGSRKIPAVATSPVL
jgi:hypothetical protein